MNTSRISSLVISMLVAMALQPAFLHADQACPGGGANERVEGCAGDDVVPVYSGAQAGGYFLIRFFQVAISPQDGPNCRHTPVCSVYGARAVKSHGVILGGCLAGERLLRCNPYRKSEIDPVPDDIGTVSSHGAGNR